MLKKVFQYSDVTRQGIHETFIKLSVKKLAMLNCTSANSQSSLQLDHLQNPETVLKIRNGQKKSVSFLYNLSSKHLTGINIYQVMYKNTCRSSCKMFSYFCSILVRTSICWQFLQNSHVWNLNENLFSSSLADFGHCNISVSHLNLYMHLGLDFVSRRLTKFAINIVEIHLKTWH
jgi:hypothetical protein